MRVARITATVLLVAGTLILLGWQFRVPVLYGVALGTFIAPNTALLFIVAGVSWFLQFSPWKWTRVAGVVLAVAAAIFDTAILAEHLLGVQFPLAHTLMFHRRELWTVDLPFGTMARTTVVALVFGFTSLAAVRWDRYPWVTDVSGLALAATSYLSLFGYLFRMRPLYGYVMALHTAILLGVFAVMIFASRTRVGVMAEISTPYAGGYVFRNVGTAIAILMPVLGAVVLNLTNAELITKELAIALFVLASVLLFVGLVFRTAVLLNSVDRQREIATAASVKNEKLAAAAKVSASVAHEINNPLAAVTNLLYLAENGNVQQRNRYVHEAGEELRRVALIVKRSLAFYRDEAAPKLISLHDIAQEVVQLFQSKLASQSVTVHVDQISTDRVLANPGEIRQIVMNLLSNALDAMTDAATNRNPELRVRTQFVDGSIELQISDNGCGIPAEIRNDLFEPFVSTKGETGTGLGLYVSRSLAEKNGGTLSFTSNSEGTTFVLALPRAANVARTAMRTRA